MTATTLPRHVPCDYCGRPVRSDAHTVHHCSGSGVCSCDGVACPDCCPDCDDDGPAYDMDAAVGRAIGRALDVMGLDHHQTVKVDR